MSYFLLPGVDLTPSEHNIRILFDDPRIRPPLLEEIQPDVERIARGLSKRYCDPSCYALSEKDIFGVVMEKFSYLISRGYLKANTKGKTMTRVDFFKIFAASANNKVRSLVQKHRFTAKRTGFKAPKRNENGFNEETRKPAEISLDNPDSHVQVAEPSGAGELAHTQIVKDAEQSLSPVEVLVFRQLYDPNQEALLYAQIDSYRTTKKKKVIKISDKNKAEGLGMLESEFLRVQKVVQQKVTIYMKNQIDTNFNHAVANLSAFFNVQVPKPSAIDQLTIRRLFTLLARDYADSLTDEVKADLEQVGALLPERISDEVNCFGVLFDRFDPSCRRCDIQESCMVKATNHGLGSITISRNLIRQTRFPVILAKTSTEVAEVESEPVILSSRDEEVYNYLSANFHRFKSADDFGFRHKDSESYSPLIVLDNQGKFRVCKPSKQLVGELEKYKASYFIPGACDAEEAITLIRLHAEQSMAEKDST